MGKVADWNRLWEREFDYGPMDAWALQLFSKLTELIAELDRPKLLSAGCGRGIIDYWILRTTNAQVTFLDLSDVVLKKISTQLKKDKIKNFEIMQGSILDIPYQDNTFDIVWNEGVLEHFDKEDFDKSLSEMVRVSNNFVLVDIPNSRSKPYLHSKEFLEKNGLWEYGQELPRPTLIDEFTKFGLTNVTEKDIGNRTTLENYLKMVPSDQRHTVLETLTQEDFKVFPHLMTLGQKPFEH